MLDVLGSDGRWAWGTVVPEAADSSSEFIFRWGIVLDFGRGDMDQNGIARWRDLGVEMGTLGGHSLEVPAGRFGGSVTGVAVPSFHDSPCSLEVSGV